MKEHNFTHTPEQILTWFSKKSWEISDDDPYSWDTYYVISPADNMYRVRAGDPTRTFLDDHEDWSDSDLVDDDSEEIPNLPPLTREERQVHLILDLISTKNRQTLYQNLFKRQDQ